MHGQTCEHTLMRWTRGRIVASLEYKLTTMGRAESAPTALACVRRWEVAIFSAAGIAHAFRVYHIAGVHCIHCCCSHAGGRFVSCALSHHQRGVTPLYAAVL